MNSMKIPIGFFTGILLSIILTSSGCTILASKDAAAGCQIADVASTHYALHHNTNASEQNTIPVPALDIIKLALAAYIKWGVSDEEWNAAHPAVRSFITIIGCGAAVNNIHVGNQRQ